jgi:hypothetical protein
MRFYKNAHRIETYRTDHVYQSFCLSVCMHVSTKAPPDGFIMDVMSLEATPTLYLLISYNL